MFGLFKKVDPVCGMKEESETGIKKDGHWFCSKECATAFEKQNKGEKNKKAGCC